MYIILFPKYKLYRKPPGPYIDETQLSPLFNRNCADDKPDTLMPTNENA